MGYRSLSSQALDLQRTTFDIDIPVAPFTLSWYTRRTSLGGQFSVTAEFVLVMNRILDICDSGVAPVMLLSDKERPYGWRVMHHVRDA
jgi:hypothetical protein